MKKIPSNVKKPVHRPAHAPGEIRLIGGQWRRIRLKVSNLPGLRPTPDRVRETLFNWLGQDLSGLRCVDAFAGTGALGFEAASRGAAEVILVEQDSTLIAPLQRALAQLLALEMPEPITPPQKITVQRGDGVAALKHLAPQSTHIIFLDPPFASDYYAAALQAAERALMPNGSIYLESPKAWTDALLEEIGLTGLTIHRHLKAGAVHAHIVRKTTE
ncbi:MAG: hypothetical protein RLZZ495_829 [Pseudomonadota bacterium]|jgi:16S rRNA (guanine(966)-N(2))-methyltransferase RsmD